MYLLLMFVTAIAFAIAVVWWIKWNYNAGRRDAEKKLDRIFRRK